MPKVKTKRAAAKRFKVTGTGKLNWVINAIKYAVEQKVDIISMSLGLSENSPKLEKVIKDENTRFCSARS